MVEKKELLQELPNKQIFATEEPLIRRVEFTGEFADVRNAMHCFLMKGFSDAEVTCSFLGQISATEHDALKVLEIPMTLTVVTGGEEPVYAYYLDREGEKVPMERATAISEVVWEDAMLNMEDTGRYVWDMLYNYFAQYDIGLGPVDLHFGHVMEHFVVMCGDFTPETMHLTDPVSGKRLWNGEDGVENAYEVLLARMGVNR